MGECSDQPRWSTSSPVDLAERRTENPRLREIRVVDGHGLERASLPDRQRLAPADVAEFPILLVFERVGVDVREGAFAFVSFDLDFGPESDWQLLERPGMPVSIGRNIGECCGSRAERPAAEGFPEVKADPARTATAV